MKLHVVSDKNSLNQIVQGVKRTRLTYQKRPHCSCTILTSNLFNGDINKMLSMISMGYFNEKGLFCPFLNFQCLIAY